MYGLPSDFDGEFMVGRRLELICFGAYQIYLHFDGHIMITIEGSFLYWRAGSGNEPPVIGMPVLESNLMSLLEHSVQKVSPEKDGTLTLAFDNGDCLRCFNNPDYESYHIKHGEHEITV